VLRARPRGLLAFLRGASFCRRGEISIPHFFSSPCDCGGTSRTERGGSGPGVLAAAHAPSCVHFLLCGRKLREIAHQAFVADEPDSFFLADLLEDFASDRRLEAVGFLRSGDQIESRSAQTRMRAGISASRKPDVARVSGFVNLRWRGGHSHTRTQGLKLK
jgi:hypothetical protein